MPLLEKGHAQESLVQKALKQAVRKAKLTGRVTSYAFRYSLATHLPADGHDIRTVQEPVGPKDVLTRRAGERYVAAAYR